MSNFLKEKIFLIIYNYNKSKLYSPPFKDVWITLPLPFYVKIYSEARQKMEILSESWAYAAQNVDLDGNTNQQCQLAVSHKLKQ
jgi:hypothetical protein